MIKKSTLLFMSILFSSLLCAGEKDKVKVKYDKDTHMVSIDGEAFIKIIREDCGLGSEDCHFDIYDNSGEVVIRVDLLNYLDPAQRSESNKNGRVNYYLWTFKVTDQECESSRAYASPKNLGKYIYEQGLMPTGTLDQSKIDEYVKRKGMKHSETQKSIIRIID